MKQESNINEEPGVKEISNINEEQGIKDISNMKEESDRNFQASGVGLWTENYKLSIQSRGAWWRLLMIFGIIPSLMFFYWLERNCRYSPINDEIILLSVRNFYDPIVVLKCLHNIRYFILFCFLHSLLARAPMKNLIQGFIPPQAIRAFYMILTGITLFFVTISWQHTELYVWQLRISHPILINLASLGIFWSLHFYIFMRISRWALPEMLGFTQLDMQAKDVALYDDRSPVFEKEGIFRWVRHPTYTLMLAMIFVTPILSLDRLWLTVMMCIYFAIAIPLQEKALVQRFGESYIKYKANTPALIPNLPHVVNEVKNSVVSMYRKIHKAKKS